MKGKVVGFMVCSVVLFSAAAGASDNGGVISFRGQVVNPTCEGEAGRPSGIAPREDSQQVLVGAKVMLVVSTYHNVCSHDVLPFTATYTALQTANPTVGGSPELGVVTLSYQ